MIGTRLLPVSGRQMVKVFRKIGFQVARQKGSHIVMSKDAGLTIDEFNRLLKK